MPAPGTSTKLVMKMEEIARWRITGRISDARIADHFGLTPQRIAQIVAMPEYKEIEEGLFAGRITDIDRKIAEDDDAIRSLHRDAIPMALRTVIEAAGQRRDLKVALAAAKDILDRDPNRLLTTQRASTPSASDSERSDGRPQLPADVITYITVHGNNVAAEIRAKSVNVVGSSSLAPAPAAERSEALDPRSAQAAPQVQGAEPTFPKLQIPGTAKPGGPIDAQAQSASDVPASVPEVQSQAVNFNWVMNEEGKA